MQIFSFHSAVLLESQHCKQLRKLTLKAASIWALRMLHLRWSGSIAGEAGGCRDFSDSCFSSPCHREQAGRFKTTLTCSTSLFVSRTGRQRVGNVPDLFVYVDVKRGQRGPGRGIAVWLQSFEKRLRDVQLIRRAGRSSTLWHTKHTPRARYCHRVKSSCYLDESWWRWILFYLIVLKTSTEINSALELFVGKSAPELSATPLVQWRWITVCHLCQTKEHWKISEYFFQVWITCKELQISQDLFEMFYIIKLVW